MLFVGDFLEAFFIFVHGKKTVKEAERLGWFDRVERVYVDEQTMRERYDTEQLDEARLIQDQYVPIPVLHEREVMKDFLREVNLEHLIDQHNGLKESDDFSEVLNYSDEDGEWLHDAWWAYRKWRIRQKMQEWIFEWRIENAVVDSKGVVTDVTLAIRKELEIPFEAVRKIRDAADDALNERDRWDMQCSHTMRRAENNELIEVMPHYRRLRPECRELWTWRTIGEINDD